MKEKQSIRIEGYIGKWSAFDKLDLLKTFYILENDYYGDETCYLVIDNDNNFICETFDDLETALKDFGIL